MYIAKDISIILGTDPELISDKTAAISKLSMDTRKVDTPKETLFFALGGSMHDGHSFIPEAINKGIKNIVTEKIPDNKTKGINLFVVHNSLKALQKLASFHRERFNHVEVLGITGSNGKTTIKEWLYQMIHDRQVVKSPKSYNSQTGGSSFCLAD